MNKNKKGFTLRKGDFIVIFFVLVLAGFIGTCFWINMRSVHGSVAVIYQNGERVKELSLDRQEEYTVTGVYQNLVRIENGQVAVIESNCPGEDCVHRGWIQQAGQSIVCLPNRMEIRIEGESEVDFVMR